MCPQFNMDDDSHRKLKAFAAEHGATMSQVLRLALERLFADPPAEIPVSIDARHKGWFLILRLWNDDTLERTSEIIEVSSTGEIPQIAGAFAGVAEAADMARADLPRLRQTLARSESSSMRLNPYFDAFKMLQIDVHRSRPEETS